VEQGDEMSRFIYLLNAMENAAQAANPAKEGYAAKRRAVLEYVEKLEVRVVEREALGCMDCGKPYSTFPLDMTIPDGQWREIHETDGGVLCANCMVARLAKLPGAIAVRAYLETA
jgi:hypothetical protein